MKFASIALLAAFPLIEIALLIRAGRWLGFWPTVLMIVLTAMAGTLVIRRQGVSVFGRTLAQIEAGRGAVEPMVDGLMQVVAGMLLIFPGIMTDILGASLLVPPVRRFVIKAMLPPLLAGGQKDTAKSDGQPGPEPDDRSAHQGVLIEGEYERIDEKTVMPARAARTQRR